MPPQPGIFSLHGNQHQQQKKRKEISGKLGKEMGDRRDDGPHYTESISALHHISHVLATRPEMNSLYKLRLFPLSLERSAQLAQFEVEERYAIECAQIAYDEERERVEEEWRRGRQRVRERLLEGIEERRRRAREEKEGEGTVGALPPFFSHFLSVDELPSSPFPLPLTSTSITNGGGGIASGGVAGNGNGLSNGGRRRAKGGGGNQGQALSGLGKSLLLLNTTKDSEIENDLGEIRRGNKRRRAVVAPGALNK